VIFDFLAKQDELKLNSTLTWYSIYPTISVVKADFWHFIFKTDYFPYFEITNTLGYFAILFYQLHQKVIKTTASIAKTKHNRDMLPASIILLILLYTFY